MNIETFIADLTHTGLILGVSPDGERITVDTTRTKLTDEQKTLIREHKSEILEILQQRGFDPKVAKGAIHYIAHRSQRWIDKLPRENLSTLMVLLYPYQTQIWNAYQKKQTRMLQCALIEYYRTVISYVWNVERKQTPTQSTV